MRVYVAASSHERDRVRQVEAALDVLGIEIAHRWWDGVEKRRARRLTDADLSDQECVDHAHADLEAVAASDVLLLLAPEEPTRGAWVELGFAIGRDVRVVVSGSPHALAQSLFVRPLGLGSDVDVIAMLAREAGVE